ncbi:MAG: hypothetical protein C0602_03740 [Denitrovibrio sp.]|nr:MAG: hypothetical protein C0602_03740 [Denitrovibrio sp.]
MNFFCSKDCPDLCGIRAEIKDDGYSFEGIPEKWSETGFVCSKFKVFAEREINSGLKSYQMEKGEKRSFEDDSQAISALAETLEEYSDKKILFMRGSGSLGYNLAYWDVLFSSFNNCWGITGGPCDETGGDAHVADFGALTNPDVKNLEQPDTIILYGKNAAVCSQHLYAYLKKLKKQGKVIIYIDPVRTKTAELADRYIMINPCTDGLLACALLTELGLENGHDTMALISKTGMSADDFDFLRSRIEKGKTAHIQGFGIQRHSNGMNSFQWINRLAVKTGCEDLLYFGHSSKRKWKTPSSSFKAFVHADKIAETLLKDDFDLFVIAGANPAMTFPDTNMWEKALSGIKTIVIDTNESKTSVHADFFLRVGGMFAQQDFMGSYFFPQHYQRGKLTKEMSDTDAVERLAEKLNISIRIKDISEVKELPQPERKYATQSLELTMPETSEKFQLITSSHHSYLNSQTLPGMEQGLQVVYINSDDAEKAGLKTGDDVKISGDTGHFTAEAVVTENIAERSVMCWKNIPMKKGYTNCAIPNKLTDSGSGLVYYTAFVDIEKA